MDFALGLRAWTSLLGFVRGLRSWASCVDFALGLRAWTSLLGFVRGLRSWASCFNAFIFNVFIMKLGFAQGENEGWILESI